MDLLSNADWLFTSDTLLIFVTLSMLEIVLGIDNLVFIALVTDKLKQAQRRKARFLGLGLALVMRIAMLFGVAWIMTLTEPLFALHGVDISIKDMLMIGGGLFLIGKATFEMHEDLAIEEGEGEPGHVAAVAASFISVVTQIMFIDLIFSFDSIITAVGMTSHISIIIAAILVSMAVMLAAAGPLSEFLRRNPTFKMLALAFVLLIGVMLLAEGFHFHFPREYIYAAFGFSIFVEGLNSLVRRKSRRLKALRKGVTL